jgi:VIT1/CCC1 family predicted Fe2+/Mn2+ transporter
MTSILNMFFAWRLYKMLAGFVLLSAAIGVLVMAATVALSMPTWITLAAYPAICSLTLLICAAVWSIRTTAPSARDRLHRQHSHS